jgi:hypothetical protein
MYDVPFSFPPFHSLEVSNPAREGDGMMLSNSWRRWFGRQTRGGCRGRRRRPAAFRPCSEALEYRLVPATFNPSSAVLDGNPNSLRDAVIEANSNRGDNVINLTAGVYLLTMRDDPAGEGTNSAGSGDLDLTTAGHTYLIQGAGPNDTFIDATQIDRVFQVLPNVTAVFRNLTLRGGRAVDDGTGAQPNTTDAHGGGLLNNGGNVTLDNVHIATDEARAVAGVRDGTRPRAAASTAAAARSRSSTAHSRATTRSPAPGRPATPTSTPAGARAATPRGAACTPSAPRSPWSTTSSS